jgi:hypothetical protein
MTTSYFSTFSRLKPGTYYTFDWEEGRQILSRIASEEGLALSVGASNFRFSHRIRRNLDVSEGEISFEYDTGDKFTCGEIIILIEFMRRADKRDVVTVFNRVQRVPKNLFECIIFLFRPSRTELIISSCKPNMHLSAYFASWMGDEDVEQIKRCIEKVVGRCLDPFGVV